MKLLKILPLILLLGFSTIADAAVVGFSWLPNEEAVSGYKIHSGTSPGEYSASTDAGNPEAVEGRVMGSVGSLEPGLTYYFAATAYNKLKLTQESVV